MEIQFNNNPVEGEFHIVDANRKYRYTGGAWVVYTNNQPLAEFAPIPISKPLVALEPPAFPQSNPFWQHSLTGVLYFQKVVEGVTSWDKVSTDTPPSGTLNADITGIAAYASRLYTPRMINGVQFDGTSDIVVNAIDITPRIASSEKGVANGVATLDGTGKVPLEQLPASVVDAPVSTAQQLALDLKANIASPSFTGTPTVPTAVPGSSSTQIATTEFVRKEIDNDGIEPFLLMGV